MEEKLSKSCKSWDFAIEEVLLKTNTSKDILIQSGHFSLLYNQFGELIPAIKEEITDEKLKEFVSTSNYMNDFPLQTFTKSIALATSLRDKGKKINFSFIVNDWQWINKGLYSFQTERLTFYKKQKLPLFYETLLTENYFSDNDILKTNHYVKDSIYFSEHKLQKSEKKEILNFCSPFSCSVEYLPFLKMGSKEADTLISFIPMLCKIPVLYSTINCINSLNRDFNMFHIFYDPHTKEIETSFLNKANLNEDVANEINDKYRIMELMSE